MVSSSWSVCTFNFLPSKYKWNSLTAHTMARLSIAECRLFSLVSSQLPVRITQEKSFPFMYPHLFLYIRMYLYIRMTCLRGCWSRLIPMLQLPGVCPFFEKEKESLRRKMRQVLGVEGCKPRKGCNCFLFCAHNLSNVFVHFFLLVLENHHYTHLLGLIVTWLSAIQLSNSSTARLCSSHFLMCITMDDAVHVLHYFLQTLLPNVSFRMALHALPMAATQVSFWEVVSHWTAAEGFWYRSGLGHQFSKVDLHCGASVLPPTTTYKG